MEKRNDKLIKKKSTDFVAHNMLMNYFLWKDNRLLIESFVRNCNLSLNFDVKNFHFCITGLDSKYNNYIEAEPFDCDVERALLNYEKIDQILATYRYRGTCFLIKVDNSKKVAIIFSPVDQPLCSPYEVVTFIDGYVKNTDRNHVNLIATSLVCNFSGFESIHVAYEEAQSLNRLAFFGIHDSLITHALIDRITIDCSLACIDENCRKLKYLCCNASLDKILYQVDIIFNQLVRNSLNLVYFSTAFTLCEIIIQLFEKVYIIENLAVKRAQCDYDSLDIYIADLVKRLVIVFEACKCRKRYSHNVLLAISYMMDNYTKDIYLTSISEFTNVNPTSLSSDFNREVKMSISEFISKLRIKKAKELLKSELTLNEIIEQVGFTNVRYFSDIFKKETLMTPLAYRKLMLQCKN